MNDHKRYDLTRPSGPMSISGRPSRDEKAIQAHHRRHEVAIHVKDILTVLAAVAICDTGGKVQEIGLAATMKASGVMQDAESSLQSEALEPFRRFMHESRSHTYRDLLWIQQVGAEGIVQMIKDSPLYDGLPPEEKGLIRKGWEAVFGVPDPWE